MGLITLSYEKKKKPDLIAEINELKHKETELNSEIQRLQTEVKFMESAKENFEKEKKNLEDKLDSKEKKVEELFQEKAVILESKNDILLQIKDKELQLQEKDQKIGDLREKFKKSSSELLTKSMQIDKLVRKDKEVIESEKIKEFEEKIKELEKELENTYHEQKAEIEKSAEGSTRIISNMDDIAKLLKKVLPQAKSTIRLVMPNIQDLSDYDLINLIQEIPNKVRLNIAAEISEPDRNFIVSELRNFCQITDYSEKKIIALNIDSSKCLIGIFRGDKVISLYSEILEIIEMLNPIIMEPFIRGRRV